MVLALVLRVSDSATGSVAACNAAVVGIETAEAFVLVVDESSVVGSVSSSFCLVLVCLGEEDSVLKKRPAETSWDV